MQRHHNVLTADSIRLNGDHPALQFAATELQRYRARLFPADSSSQGRPGGSIAFHLGLFDEADVQADLLKNGFDREAIRRAGPEAGVTLIGDGRVGLYGARPRAVLYAVYDFLRDACGIEFAISAAGIESFPVNPERDLPGLRRLSQPAFPVRGFGLHGATGDDPKGLARLIDWAAKLKFNRIQIDVRAWELAGKELGPLMEERDLDLDLGIHSLNYFVPAEAHAEQHPDWYASVANRFGRQLRFSNLASVPVVVENVKRLLERFPSVKCLGLWPLDGTGFDPDEIAAGDMGGLVLRYVNAVTEKIAAARPDLVIDHLAYIGYAAPPKETRPHPQVMTSVCHYWDQSFTQPICDAWYGRGRWASEEAKEKARRGFHPMRTHAECCRDLAGWVRLGPAVVFTYYVDHNLSGQNVFDTPRVIQADLRYYKALGLQGSVTCYCMDPQFPWFFRDLHALAACLWDPEVDWAGRDASLLTALFGSAGPAMRTFYTSLDALHNQPLFNGFRLADLIRGIPSTYQLSGYNPDLHEAVLRQVAERMGGVLALLDSALAAADCQEMRERVAGIRVNLVMQKAFALFGCHVLAAFGCRDLAVSAAAGEKAALEARALELHDRALGLFNEWVADFERSAPDWANLAGKIKAYRVALEKDFRAIRS
jgi:hypothetical protein